MSEDFEKPRILIVDDLEIIRELIKSFYAGYAVELFEAVDGQEAVDLARACRPDLILLDIQMPKMDGYEAATILKHDEAAKGIPILVITGLELELVVERMNGRCEGYLSKPFQKADFIAATMPYLPGMRNKNGDAEKESF